MGLDCLASRDMESEVITENRRIIRDTRVIGTVSIAYPNKTDAIILGLVSLAPLSKHELKALFTYIKNKGYTKLTFYRIKNGKEVKKEYKL